MKTCEHLLRIGEFGRVDGKGFVIVLNVDIHVYAIEGNLIIPISLDRPLHLVPGVITIAALMIPRAVARLESRFTNQRGEAAHDVLGLTARKQEEIELAEPGSEHGSAGIQVPDIQDDLTCIIYKDSVYRVVLGYTVELHEERVRVVQRLPGVQRTEVVHLAIPHIVEVEVVGLLGVLTKRLAALLAEANIGECLKWRKNLTRHDFPRLDIMN